MSIPKMRIEQCLLKYNWTKKLDARTDYTLLACSAVFDKKTKYLIKEPFKITVAQKGKAVQVIAHCLSYICQLPVQVAYLASKVKGKEGNSRPVRTRHSDEQINRLHNGVPRK